MKTTEVAKPVDREEITIEKALREIHVNISTRGPTREAQCKPKPIMGKNILIGKSIRLNHAVFKHCIITIAKDVSVSFDHSKFFDCCIKGTGYSSVADHSGSHLILNYGKMEETRICGWYNSVLITSLETMRDVCFDSSLEVNDLKMNLVDFFEGSFSGSYRRAQFGDMKFRQLDNWSPFIIDQITFRSTRFTSSIVTMSDWINKAKIGDDVDFLEARKLKDNWATLRDEYTGFKLYWILVMTLVFIIPYCIKALFLIIAKGIPFTSSDEAILLKVLMSGDLEGWKMWGAWLFGSILIIYNLLRFALTMKVARLREREEHLIQTNIKINRPYERQLVWLSSAPVWLSWLSWPSWLSWLSCWLSRIIKLILNLLSCWANRRWWWMPFIPKFILWLAKNIQLNKLKFSHNIICIFFYISIFYAIFRIAKLLFFLKVPVI